MLAITIVICIFLFLMAALILGHIEKRQEDRKDVYEILEELHSMILDLKKNKASIDELKTVHGTVGQLHCLISESRTRIEKIEDRAARIRKNRNIIRDYLVRIAIDYKWIRERAGYGYNKTEYEYRESKKTYFMLDGKGLSIEEIDSMNTDFEKSVLDLLNR